MAFFTGKISDTKNNSSSGSRSVQAKLRVSQPGDVHEQEAEKAEQAFKNKTGQSVQSADDSNSTEIQPKINNNPNHVFRKFDNELADGEFLPNAPGTDIMPSESNTETTSPAFNDSLSNSSSLGESLSDQSQEEMGSFFQSDFSDVRVHHDDNAESLNNEIGSRAFTHGNDIYFNKGEYNPGSDDGKALLAHELTHTMQQSDGAKRKAIYRAKSKSTTKTPPPPPSNVFTDKVVGSIDTGAKTMTIPRINVPPFKFQFGPNKKFNLPVGGVDRKGTHIAAWEKAATASGSKFISEFNKKTKEENAPNLKDKGKPIFYLTLRAGQNTRKKSVYRGDYGVIFGTKETILSKIARPYWTVSGYYKPHDVDHKRELQLGGNETDTDNLWMLEASANRSSGSLINNEISNRINAVLMKSPSNLISKPTEKAVRSSYTITVEKGVAHGKKSAGSPQYNWSLERIKAGRHLKGLKFLTEKAVAKSGLTGSPDELVIFTNKTGGKVIRIPWDEAAQNSNRKDGMSLDLGRKGKGFAKINTVVYKPTEGVDEAGGTGLIICTVEDGKHKLLKKQKENKLSFRILPIAGVKHGGYIERDSIKTALRRAELVLKSLSPITLVDGHIDNVYGIVAKGKVKSTIPFLEKADIDIDLVGNEIIISKTFTSEEISLPKPFKTKAASLTLFVASSGRFGFSGGIQFEINKVGEGTVNAHLDSKGNMGLNGKFDIASDIFEKSTINFSFERTSDGENKYSIGGEVSVGKDKVRGLKHANAVVNYTDGKLSAQGKALLDLKGVEEIEMFFETTSQGYKFGGKLKLAGKIPKLKEGEVEIIVSKSSEGIKVAGKGKAVLDIVGFQGTSISIAYDNGAIMIVGVVPFKFGKARAEGKITAGITNQVLDEEGKPTNKIAEEWTIFGKGNVKIILGKGIAATAEVELNKKGHVIISGELGLDKSVDDSPKKKEFDKTIFEIGPPPIVLLVIPPIAASLVLEIKGGARIYASFTPPHLKELSLGFKNFNLTEPDKNSKIVGKVKVGMSGKAGFELFVKLTATLSVLVAKVSGWLKGALGLEAKGSADASLTAEWSEANGLEVTKGELSLEAEAQFIASLEGGIRVYLDLWLAEIDIWEEKLKIAEARFGDKMKVGIKLPVFMKDGEIQTPEPSKEAIQFPDLSSESKQQEIVEQGAKQDEKVKPPPPPSKEEALSAVRRLDAGPTRFWQVATMDGDDARAMVSLGWISRDTYIQWLMFKHPKLDWREVVELGRRRDRADFNEFKADIKYEQSDFRRLIKLANFKDDHYLFNRYNKNEINKLYSREDT